MDRIGQILEKIAQTLIELGFEAVEVSNEYRSQINYRYKSLYCLPIYVEGLGFIIEYAGSAEDAERQLHEDGGIFPLEWGEKAILVGIETEVKKEIIK